SSPSGNSGYVRYKWSATTSPRTASPSNSRRSLGSRPGCSAHHDRWARARANSSWLRTLQPCRAARTARSPAEARANRGLTAPRCDHGFYPADQLVSRGMMGHFHGVEDGPGARGAVADHAYSLHPEEHRTTISVRVQLVGQGSERGQHRLGRLFDDGITGKSAQHAPSFDVPDEVHFRPGSAGIEQGVGLLHEGVALGRLLADGQDADPGVT